MSNPYHFAPIETDTASLNAIANCLAEAFGQSSIFTQEFIQWQYAANPDGKVVGFNAWHNGQIVAHYALQPFVAQWGDETLNCLLSLNTATTKAHRGKGLFTQLARKSYDLGRSLGYHCVLGVANANSMPGFIDKLGFHTLGPLEVRIGMGPLPKPKAARTIRYRRLWNEKNLAWRLNKPNNRYHWHHNSSLSRLMSSTAYSQIEACLGSFETTAKPSQSKSPKAIKLWMGLDPRLDFGLNYIKLPQRLRPSPLHLILLDLTDSGYTLDRTTTLFQALDFDAY